MQKSNEQSQVGKVSQVYYKLLEPSLGSQFFQCGALLQHWAYSVVLLRATFIGHHHLGLNMVALPAVPQEAELLVVTHVVPFRTATSVRSTFWVLARQIAKGSVQSTFPICL